jgi:hypothetical protein
MRSRVGKGASGRFGRLGLLRSRIEFGNLPESGLGVTAECDGVEVAALAAFSLLICSLRSRISDFFDSIAAAGGVGLGSGVWVLSVAGLLAPVVVGVATSTSPSSTSMGVGLDVETPRELHPTLDCHTSRRMVELT